MKRQHWISFDLAGVNLTSFGMEVPSPFVSLNLTDSQISSFTSWTLKVTVGGDATRKINIAAFEGLLYTAAQAASAYPDAAGVPVAFAFGWLNDNGQIAKYVSYQGFTLTFKVSTSGMYMSYTLTGYASQVVQANAPVLRLPEISGFVQPSAVVEGLLKACKATTYYELDIDHNDAPTLVSHGPMTTSLNKYIRGEYNGEDDFETFPGLLRLSKSYNSSRDAAGLARGQRKLSTILNNRRITPVSNFLKPTPTDTSPQCSSFSYWVTEPTMTSPGVIHYKSNAGLLSTQADDVLKYGTADTNIISISGSYNGVAYNMTNMQFSSVGFTVDGSGNQILQDEQVVNSWSASLNDVFQTVNIINDINALASQFSGDFSVQLPGSLKQYAVAQPVTLLIVSGNTISPASGIYSIISVSQDIGSTFTTTLKLQRLVMSSANQVASAQGIYISGTNAYPMNSYEKTSNIISTSKVDLGTIYPTFEHMYTGG